MTANEWLWVDGEPGGMVPADDRGLLLADGVFETIRIEDHQPCLYPYHKARMADGLAVLQFASPAETAERALREVLEWACAHDGHNGRAILRVTLTRGSGPRGYLPPTDPKPRVIARLTSELPQAPAPSRLTTVSIAWSEQMLLSGVKLLSRTEQSLASLEARKRGYDDALMRNIRGSLISGASGNLFIRCADTLLTPELSGCGIAGTRRTHILAGLGGHCGYKVRQAECDIALLDDADEIFICNAVMGIWPVQSVTHDGLAWAFPDHSACRRLSPFIHTSLS